MRSVLLIILGFSPILMANQDTSFTYETKNKHFINQLYQTYSEYIKSKEWAVPDELFNEKELAKIADKYEFLNTVVTEKEINYLVLAKNE